PLRAIDAGHAFLVQPGRDVVVAVAVDAPVEHALHDLHAVGRAGHIPHDVALGLLHGFAGLEHADHRAVGTELLLAAVRQPAERAKHLARGGAVLLVVAVGRLAAGRALLLHDVRDRSANAVARQLHGVLAGLPRLHALEQLAFL